MVTGYWRSTSKVPHVRSSMSHKNCRNCICEPSEPPERSLQLKWRHMQFWRHSSVGFWHKQDLHRTGYNVEYENNAVLWPSWSRSIIKFCQKATHRLQLMKRFKLQRGTVPWVFFLWHTRFKDGKESIENTEREWRKRTITATLVASNEQALQEDIRLTVRTLSDMFGISIGTIYTILREDLLMTFLLSLFY